MIKVEFKNIAIKDFFAIEDLGHADFIKRSDTHALCLESFSATYLKAIQYAILSDQQVMPDCYENL